MNDRIVIFDLDGTLRESHPHFMDALYGCLQDMDMDVDSSKWRMAERWVHAYWAQSPELLSDVQEYGSEQIWNRFLSRLMALVGHPHADNMEVVQFGDRMKIRFQPVSVLTPGTMEVLTTLQAHHIPLAVLSNREKPFVEELEELGISTFFDFALAAGEIGVWKPQSGIFQAALDRAGVTQEQAVYIGDNYYADIIGARNAGLDAILVDWRRVFTDVLEPRVETIVDILPYLLDDGYHLCDLQG